MKTTPKPMPIFRCNQCSFIGKDEASLEEHSISTHKAKKPRNVEFTKKAGVDVTKVPETVEILDDEDNDVTAPTLKCSTCRFETSSQLSLNKHLWNAHKKRNMKCSECPFIAGHFVDFQNHIKKSHNHEECHNCGFAATERSAMDDHMAKCKFVRCNKCDHSAPDQSHLVIHLKNVHDIIRSVLILRLFNNFRMIITGCLMCSWTWVRMTMI